MKRRTLDLAFGIGGLIVAALLVALGMVLRDQANFAEGYVKDQLTDQRINFTPLENLSDEEKQADCLVEFAGTALDSGKKAECYANEYIALHLRESATEAGFPGETYASIGTVQRQLRSDLQAATDAGQPTDQIQADLDEVNGLRDSMFRGETLRGLLLTTYGFSIFGERADLAATIVYLFAGLMLVLSIAGLVHAFTTKKDETVLLVAHEPVREPELV